MPNNLITTVGGEISSEKIRAVLPHEHLFVDLCDQHSTEYMNVRWGNKIGAMIESLDRLKAQEVDLLVDWTCIGVGRNALILREASHQSGVAVCCATGVYKNRLPAALTKLSVEQLARFFVSEINEGIDNTPIKATFIKTAVSEEGATVEELKIVRAASMAAAQTGVAIGLHGPISSTCEQVLNIVMSEGVAPQKLIVAHAQVSSTEQNQTLLDIGCTLQFDGLGAWSDEFFNGPVSPALLIARLDKLYSLNFGRQILISADAAVCMHPAHQQYDRNNYFVHQYFAPMLQRELGAEIADQLLRTNPLRTFAKPDSPSSSTSSDLHLLRAT